MHAGGSSTHIVSTSIGGIKGLLCGVRVWRGVRVCVLSVRACAWVGIVGSISCMYTQTHRRTHTVTDMYRYIHTHMHTRTSALLQNQN